MAQRIGIFGGAFDPPHVGHLILGETARQQLSLHRVLFMPTGQPPHKENRSVAPIRHRMTMTELAVADNAAFFASAIDAERPAPHFTSTLRPRIEAAYPGDELVLLIGGDSLHDLPEWHEPHVIVDQWQIAALPRPEYDIDWEQLEMAVPGIRQATTILDGPSVALSSTQIRRWVGAGRSLRYLLPPSVSRHIHENGLYRSRPGTAKPIKHRP